jgi:hypothetical protein
MDENFVWSSICALRDAVADNSSQFKLGYIAKVRCPTTLVVDEYRLEVIPDRPFLRHWVKLSK